MADHPTARFIFLTLTVRNCDLKDLKNTLAMMNKAWDKLQRRKSFPAIGWVKSVEVTRGKDGSAHPHFHCLLMVKGSYFKRGYVSQQTWTDWWQDVLGVDYSPVVNVKRVKNRKKSKVNNTVNSKLTGDISQLESAVRSDQVSKPVLDEDLLAAVLETVKYSVKAEDYVKDSDWLIELTKQLHKTRAIALGGLIKQYVKEDEPEDLITEEPTEDIDLEDQDLLLIFDWAEILRRYAKRS
jgi:plasmid rolling circle replication initiator protein Rep